MHFLAPGRNTGPALFGTAFKERLTWAGGIFYVTDNYGDSEGDLSATARVTGLLWDSEDESLFHLGVAFSRRGEKEIRFRVWPESLVLPEFIDTDGFSNLSDPLIKVQSAHLYGFESAWVKGPFSTQAEYARMNINQKDEPHTAISGFYWNAGYFLTGEQRPYERNWGSFGGVTPHSDFMSPDGGLGAFELGIRYSRLDLDDHTFQYGGKMTDYTVGLNWYLNPMVVLTLNYIHSHLHGEGSADILTLRTALNF
jgi:phosphate-selective porin OprO/OprP